MSNHTPDPILIDNDLGVRLTATRYKDGVNLYVRNADGKTIPMSLTEGQTKKLLALLSSKVA